ncbi:MULTISPECIES: hypothetical protein [Thermoactinomyces]|jgi:hypothetical protein|uniref:Uncharacterized protein n=1 Tax=Thermoactinomyces daqus TaxID=1329516 RepID=A0A7W2AID2_9BACL|nr:MULTISPECIES: hypothetical protein [Thermoactinomyces]MBA4542743.1 hypothetical protein [Thermoactinomyces daqus]MBH8598586.1 hypothetical protein [Thermoactinomyces sp. CICC 10523]
MEIIAGLLLVFFIGMSIVVNVLYRLAKRKKHRLLYVLPDLGMQDHGEEFRGNFRALLRHLEQSLSERYVERVKERVIREHQISLTEWENRWFEWKRYLIMAALLKSVPMFSREVDEIWHEKLMFTREYEDFCRRYLKTALHHAPNKTDAPFNPQERAWFDLVYVLLFKPTRYSLQTWGPFLRHSLSREFLEEFKKEDEDRLAEKYFNTRAQNDLPGAGVLVRHLIQYIKKLLREVEHHAFRFGTDVDSFRKNAAFQPQNKDLALSMVKGVIFLSSYFPESFRQRYQELFGKDPGSEDELGCFAASGSDVETADGKKEFLD